MTPRNRPSVIRETDAKGNPIVRVPLDAKGSRWAMVDADDYHSLPVKLREAPWFVNRSGPGYEYVKAANTKSPAVLVLVHRVIAGARPGQAVHFHGIDHCDLRRSNMYVKKDGRAKRDHLREIVSSATEPQGAL